MTRAKRPLALLPERPPERNRDRLVRLLVPKSTGALYTTGLGTLCILSGVFIVVHAYLTGRSADVPSITDELFLSGLGLLGIHQLRASRADRINAAAGYAPVPVEDVNATGADPAFAHSPQQYTPGPQGPGPGGP